MLLLGLLIVQAQSADPNQLGLRQAMETAVVHVLANAGHAQAVVRDAKAIYVSIPSFQAALGTASQDFPVGWLALGQAAGPVGIASASDVVRCGTGSAKPRCFAIRPDEIIVRADSVVRGATSMCVAISVGWSVATSTGTRRNGGLLYEVAFQRSGADRYVFNSLRGVPPVFTSVFPQKHPGPLTNRQMCGAVASG